MVSLRVLFLIGTRISNLTNINLMKNQFLNRIFPTALILGLILHIPVAFAMPHKYSFPTEVATETEVNAERMHLTQLYEDLDLEKMGLSDEAYEMAIEGYMSLKEKKKFAKDELLTIIDFSLPSTKKRLFILDVEEGKVLYNTLVAHGRGSGKLMAETFSNIPESYQSSLGFYETSGTYVGKNGFSMKLKGLEKGINHKAEERAIVVHAASYVSEQFIKQQGYLGRSHGCPALPENLNKPIINKIKDGSLMFIYSKKSGYTKQSPILKTTKLIG